MKTLIVILLILLAIGLFVFMYNRDVFGPQQASRNFNVIAHRGASGYAPENTLAAVQKALDMGADMVEIDVHLSRDGEVVVIHDPTLERTTSGKGEVSNKTLTELRQLDAGLWFGEAFRGEKIPTLAEVLQLIDGKATLLIEIKKGTTGLYSGIEQKVIDQINAHQARSWSIIQSFEPEVVQNIHRLDTALELHKLITANLPVLPIHHDGRLHWTSAFSYDYVDAINPHFQPLTRRFVNMAHKRGLKVFTYTVNEPSDMRAVRALGVDGIITNYPDLALRLKKD
ncbi:MAG: glycerophosphodiester phosphodiesterase [Bacteroidetes bacterium]|nr:MAG: glycerophosphodiester phosphodiesterase [Bacteroidota bacterium]